MTDGGKCYDPKERGELQCGATSNYPSLQC